MSDPGGEESPAKGRQFEHAAQTLLEHLRCKVVFFNKHGFDLVADPPDPTEKNLSPVFVPRGRTAFEFKGGKGKSTQSIAKKLRGKLKKAKRSNLRSVRNITFGVVVVEGYVSDLVKQRMLNKYMIPVWDFRTILFLVCKVHNQHVLGERETSFKEFRLDSSTTVVYETRSSKIGNKDIMRFICQAYYANPVEQLTSEGVRSMISALTKKLVTIAKGLTMPTYANVDFYSLAGFTDDVTPRLLGRILEANSAGRIIYDTNPGVHGFNTAPWAFLL